MTGQIATLAYMTDAKSTRELAGEIVRAFANRAGMDIVDVERESKLSHSAIYDFLNGKPTVQAKTLHKIEGALKWPMGFLAAVISGDRITIELFDDCYPELCQYTLRMLAELDARTDYRRNA